MSSVFFKTYVMRVLGLLIIVFLPEIIVPVASSIYKDAFYADVVTSLGEVVSNDEPYCIIVPRVNELLIPLFLFSRNGFIRRGNG